MGTIIGLYYEFSFRNFILTIRQITWQSNFLALTLAFLYLWKPSLLIFSSNQLFIVCASMLTTSTVIFAFLLFPVYLNLNIFYFPSLYIPLHVNVFWNIWNHFVTLIAFINLLAHRYNNNEKKEFLFSKRKTAIGYALYWGVNILLNIYFSTDNSQILPYGALANWYWGRSLAKDASANNPLNPPIIYNFQLSFFSFFIVMSTIIGSFSLYWIFFESKSRRKSTLLRAFSPHIYSY